MSQIRTALTIAGSDPSGGAGIQADLKTFAAHGVFGLSAITAVTVQNSFGVSRIAPLAANLVSAQIDAVVSDLGAHATKIGMLTDVSLVSIVADAIERHTLANVVVDPIIATGDGHRVLDELGTAALRTRLLPLASVVTPNLAEAEALTGVAARDVDGLRQAAARLVRLGARAAIVKGGHLEGPAIDVLYDGETYLELRAERIPDRALHGAGCTFSSALAARLALGDDLAAAFRAAKEYVTRAIAQSPALGRGRRPLQHFPDQS